MFNIYNFTFLAFQKTKKNRAKKGVLKNLFSMFRMLCSAERKC